MTKPDQIARTFGANASLLIRGLRRRYGVIMPADEPFSARASNIDGERLSSLILAHDLSPSDLMHPAITSVLPPDWWAWFLRRHQEISNRTLARVGEMQLLCGSIERAGIDVRFWKGPMLSLLLYGDLTSRPTRDIDILIRPDDLIPMRRLLCTHGYIDERPLRESSIPQYMSTHREWVMRRATENGMLHYVELQLSPAMPWSLSRAAQAMAFSDRQLVNLGKSSLPIPDPEIHWLMLAAHHGYAEGWRQLRQVSDMAAFASLPPGRVNTDRLLELSECYGLKRTLTIGLGLAQRLAGISVPPGGIKSFEQHERLIDKFEDRLLHHPIPLKSEESLEAIRRQWVLADDVRARGTLLWGHLRKWLAPGYVELAIVQLPAALSFLYVPLKVLRPLIRWFLSTKAPGS
jgi:hypothetical protein